VPAYTATQSTPAHLYAPHSNNKVITAPAPRTKPTLAKTSTKVQAAQGYYYSIKKGDTLYGIALALRRGVTVSSLGKTGYLAAASARAASAAIMLDPTDTPPIAA